MDLRSTTDAVTRLPFDGDRLLQILCGIEPGAANDQKDTDHSIL